LFQLKATLSYFEYVSMCFRGSLTKYNLKFYLVTTGIHVLPKIKDLCDGHEFDCAPTGYTSSITCPTNRKDKCSN